MCQGEKWRLFIKCALKGDRKLKILLVTDTLIRNDNSVGNSYTNIFGGCENIEVFNICCQQGKSENNISKKCYQISEKLIVGKLRNRVKEAGIVEQRAEMTEEQNKVSGTRKMFNLARIFRFQIFFWIRELIWSIGNWKNSSLKAFVDECDADILFVQLQDKIYLNRVAHYVKKISNLPMVAYTWDDVYSLKRLKFSPLWWIDRLFQRKWIRKIVSECELLYVISQEQKDEYSLVFNKRCELLYKGYEFEDGNRDRCDVEFSTPIKIIYTGNLYGGRWQTISKIVKALDEINKDRVVAKLYIYSATPMLKKHIEKISDGRNSEFCGQKTSLEVKQIQQKADILLHVEALSLKDSLITRLSFSTKLVDYFNEKKCVLAVGSSRTSSMKYLVRNDAAFVIEREEDIRSKLEELLSNEETIHKYAKNGWLCGKRNHQIFQIQKKLFTELQYLAKEEADCLGNM